MLQRTICITRFASSLVAISPQFLSTGSSPMCGAHHKAVVYPHPLQLSGGSECGHVTAITSSAFDQMTCAQRLEQWQDVNGVDSKIDFSRPSIPVSLTGFFQPSDDLTGVSRLRFRTCECDLNQPSDEGPHCRRARRPSQSVGGSRPRPLRRCGRLAEVYATAVSQAWQGPRQPRRARKTDRTSSSYAVVIPGT